MLERASVSAYAEGEPLPYRTYVRQPNLRRRDLRDLEMG
jgi:hypothetical protein